MKQYVGTDGQPRTSAEIEAAHLGHDLSWGRATFERVSRAAALGHDRTADPDVQAPVRAIARGRGAARARVRPTSTPTASSATTTTRPATRPATTHATTTRRATAGHSGLGDPETDDYEVVAPLSA